MKSVALLFACLLALAFILFITIPLVPAPIKPRLGAPTLRPPYERATEDNLPEATNLPGPGEWAQQLETRK